MGTTPCPPHTQLRGVSFEELYKWASQSLWILLQPIRLLPGGQSKHQDIVAGARWFLPSYYGLWRSPGSSEQLLAKARAVVPASLLSKGHPPPRTVFILQASACVFFSFCFYKMRSDSICVQSVFLLGSPSHTMHLSPWWHKRIESIFSHRVWHCLMTPPIFFFWLSFCWWIFELLPFLSFYCY